MAKPASAYTQNEKGEYVCPDCGITKNRKNTMFYHMKTHTGEKRYICTEPGCDKAFVQKSGLTQHMRQVHPEPMTNVSHACPCCDHTAAIKSNLLIHIGRKHGSGWIPALEGNGTCNGCARYFASPTAYFYHAISCFEAPAPIRKALDLCTITKAGQEAESTC